MFGEDEIVGECGGIKCRYTPTIMSGPVFRWRMDRAYRGLEISASRDGVVFQGCSDDYQSTFQPVLQAVLDVVFKVHEALKTLPRHRDTERARELIKEWAES